MGEPWVMVKGGVMLFGGTRADALTLGRREGPGAFALPLAAWESVLAGAREASRVEAARLILGHPDAVDCARPGAAERAVGAEAAA